MRANPKKTIKINGKVLEKQDIGHVKAIMRNPDRFDGEFFYLIEFSKIGIFEIPQNLLDTF